MEVQDRTNESELNGDRGFKSGKVCIMSGMSNLAALSSIQNLVSSIPFTSSPIHPYAPVSR